MRHSQALKHFSHPLVTKSAILNSSNTSAIHQLPSPPFSSPQTLQPSISYQVRHSQALKHFSHPLVTKSAILNSSNTSAIHQLPSPPFSSPQTLQPSISYQVRHSQALKHFSHPLVTKSAILKSSNTSATSIHLLPRHQPVRRLPSLRLSSYYTVQASMIYEVLLQDILPGWPSVIFQVIL